MVDNARNALYEVKKVLYHHYQLLITKEFWVDHDRKAVITTREGKRFYVLFKREFFYSYGKITGRGGAGESINVQDFEYCVYAMDIEDFIYVYPNNNIYKIRAREIREEGYLYDNDADGKEQYLFPVTRLQRLAGG